MQQQGGTFDFRVTEELKCSFPMEAVTRFLKEERGCLLGCGSNFRLIFSSQREGKFWRIGWGRGERKLPVSSADWVLSEIDQELSDLIWFRF